MLLDFTCAARVSLTIEAESEEKAHEQWNEFCRGIHRTDNVVADNPGVPAFRVGLLDGKPDVEPVED